MSHLLEPTALKMQRQPGGAKRNASTTERAIAAGKEDAGGAANALPTADGAMMGDLPESRVGDAPPRQDDVELRNEEKERLEVSHGEQESELELPASWPSSLDSPEHVKAGRAYQN